MALSGIDAQRVGFTVKSRLRDFLKAKINASNGSFYSKWRGFDCLMVDELEGSEAPNEKPLLSIHTQRRMKVVTGGQKRVDFILELHVLADGSSGAVVGSDNPVASDEQLSDDAESALESAAAIAELADLGLEGVTVGERRESVREGLHTNITLVSCRVKLA